MIKDNPRNITLDEFTEFLTSLFAEIRALRGELIETHEYQFLRYVLDYFNMTLSVPVETAELEIFDAIMETRKADGVDEMLALLREKGIRTGVVSNLCWSGNALTRRMFKSFPGHRFEFIMTSSEYVFRKPDRHIFDLAARKAGLPPESIWYCGNNVKADIIGAHNAGMFPVFYDDRSIEHCERLDNDVSEIDFPYLRITSWGDLAKAITCG